MKRIVFILLLFIGITHGAASQEKLEINYDEIKESVLNEKEYYKEILNLYLSDNEMFRLSDYAYLYYGQSFLPAYNAGNDENEKTMKKYVDEENYEKIYSIGKKILSYNPVCINALFNVSQAARRLGKPETEINSYYNKYWGLLYMISQSGDGKSTKTAFKVISSIDQYYLMYGYFEIEDIIAQDFDRTTFCNIFQVSPNEKYNSFSLYIDVSRFLLETANNIKRE